MQEGKQRTASFCAVFRHEKLETVSKQSSMKFDELGEYRTLRIISDKHPRHALGAEVGGGVRARDTSITCDDHRLLRMPVRNDLFELCWEVRVTDKTYFFTSYRASLPIVINQWYTGWRCQIDRYRLCRAFTPLYERTTINKLLPWVVVKINQFY